MSEELKPVKCGCGGEAHVSDYKTVSGETAFYVSCRVCDTSTRSFLTKDKAITAWNRAMGATDMNVGDKFAKDMNVPRKGKWLWDEEEDRCYCSECGNEDDLSIDGVYIMHDFCPNCGADMRI